MDLRCCGPLPGESRISAGYARAAGRGRAPRESGSLRRLRRGAKVQQREQHVGMGA